MSEVACFKKLPWQLRQWEFFVNRFTQANLPHALLLSGMQGLGKKQFAKQLVAVLLCEASSTAEACQQCASCRLYQANNHPDYYEIALEEDAKNIKIDAIRQLSQQLASTAQRGGNKVALVYPAEAMNVAASNALLKTLEEPPQNTIIILVSSQIDSLLATVRSRCQLINFAMPAYAETVEWLKQQRVEQPEMLTALAEGAPLTALELAEDESLLQQYTQFMKGLLNYKSAIALSEISQKLLAAPLLKWLQQFYLDLIKLKHNAGGRCLAHQQYHQELWVLSEQFTREQCHQSLEAVQKLEKLMRKQSNLNIQLQLTSLFIELFEIYERNSETTFSEFKIKAG
jgi:DNA polymerase-3 subunit delta'